MDAAGNSATKRGIDLAQQQEFNIRVITMPENPDVPGILFKDPADVVFKNPKIWEDCVKNAKTIHDFYFQNLLSKFDKNTVEGKKKISQALLPVIKKIPNKIEQTLWIQSLGNILGIKEQDILVELDKVAIDKEQGNAKTQNTNEAQNEARNTEVPNERKDMLEEYLSLLAIKSPGLLNLVKEEDSRFFSPRFIEIANCIKTGEIKEELKSFIDCLSLKADVMEEGGGFDIEQEFNSCFKRIKEIEVKNTLDNICMKIKESEAEKDAEKTQKLVEKFSLYSKQLETD